VPIPGDPCYVQAIQVIPNNTCLAGKVYLWHLCFRYLKLGILTVPSDLNRQGIRSAEESVTFYQTPRHHSPNITSIIYILNRMYLQSIDSLKVRAKDIQRGMAHIQRLFSIQIHRVQPGRKRDFHGSAGGTFSATTVPFTASENAVGR
jgi:hypothetical protein